jgi:hypothetical protein
VKGRKMNGKKEESTRIKKIQEPRTIEMKNEQSNSRARDLTDSLVAVRELRRQNKRGKKRESCK